MHFDKFSFGTLRIDGSSYERDVVRPRRNPQTQEDTLQEIPSRVSAYTPVYRRKDSLDMPPASDQHRSVRPLARYEGSET